MKVVAVITCYNPDPTQLRRTCDALRKTGAGVVLIDNSDSSRLEQTAQFSDCTIIANRENAGIARAQNQGITHAVQAGADVIVFFDQDSIVEPGFLDTLLAPLQPGIPGVVAPISYDAARSFEYPAQRITRLGFPAKVFSAGRTEPYEVDIVMSSGTAATVSTFERAGLMAEDLFIDFVDTEWSLRCRRAGVRIRMVPSAVMRHSIGSRSIRLGFATVLVHSPTRCYYQIRNCVRLFRKKSVPAFFAVREGLAVAAHRLLLLLAVPGRRDYLRAMVEGFRDGLAGVTGRRRDQQT